MKQTDLNLDLTNRRARKRTFLGEMERVGLWKEFVELIAPHAPTKAMGQRPFPIEAMLRIHFLQQWFGLSDVAMEEALYDAAAGQSSLGAAPNTGAASANFVGSSNGLIRGSMVFVVFAFASFLKRTCSLVCWNIFRRTEQPF
ncbi:hypothetical protein WJ73_16160 [Burkholderia ubonensis]|nr:hypothetical protein WJ73_16160 [Burkholderia ubonensis]